MKFSFDLILSGAVTVEAETQDEAINKVIRQFEYADCNGGTWPNGDPVLFEASLADIPIPYGENE